MPATSPADDERIIVSYETCDSPAGGGKMLGYLARPAKPKGGCLE